MTEDNSHAGQGAVVLDIGDDIGAVVINMPAQLAGREVAIAPSGTGQGHTLSGHGSQVDAAGHRPHVGVVARPAATGRSYAAVFAAVHSGWYQLSLLPDGPPMVQVQVRGGEVTFADWPAVMV